VLYVSNKTLDEGRRRNEPRISRIARVKGHGQIRVMPISDNTVLGEWEKFLRGGVEAYERAAQDFREKQPELWRVLRRLDDEWFSGKTDHVAAHGVFVWRMMTAEYGTIERVSKELLDELTREELEFAERLEDESEYRAKEAVAERLRNFPEPALAALIQREFSEGSAGAKELNPQNNQIAVRWLLVGIRALGKSGAR
jgi:hypothetical protein